MEDAERPERGDDRRKPEDADQHGVEDPGRQPHADERQGSGEQAHPESSSDIVYDATTTQNVMSAATETSKPPTSSALVWPSETSASGIVTSSRLWRLYS